MMLRRLHTYMSIVSAPIIVFFCLTGALQLFDWQTPRGAYHPPAWIEKLSVLHKKQRFELRGGLGGQRSVELPSPAGTVLQSLAASDGATMRPAGGQRRSQPGSFLRVQLLRWVFLFATLSLVASTVLGAWIGLTHARRKRLCWALLSLGAVIPFLLVAL